MSKLKMHEGCSLIHYKVRELADKYAGLLKMTVRVLTTCHTQYTWDRSM